MVRVTDLVAALPIRGLAGPRLGRSGNDGTERIVAGDDVVAGLVLLVRRLLAVDHRIA